MKTREDDLRAWALVAATVRPLPGRAVPVLPGRRDAKAPRPASESPPISIGAHRPPARGPDGIEPGRYRRMAIGREPIGARVDLHGLDQARAHAALTAFISDAFDRGLRGVLVITGKGTLGDGVLRRRVPDWLGEAPLRALIAGLSEAHRRHGGAGALYVALKRRGSA